MEQILHPDIATLPRLTASELRTRYAEVFGEVPPTWNRVWMLKRIAWRLQALAEGGLSERAQLRAEELATEADLRMTPPRMKADSAAPERTATVSLPDKPDDRLPPPGTILTRPYKGQTVKVLGENAPHPSLQSHDFSLRKEVAAFFHLLAALGAGEIVDLEIGNGLPFCFEVIEKLPA